MSMFCFQCQETARNQGCTVRGVCGKTDDIASMQDLMIYLLKGISVYGVRARALGVNDPEVGRFILKGLFATITNVNFSAERFVTLTQQAVAERERVKTQFLAAYQQANGQAFTGELPHAATWTPGSYDAAVLAEAGRAFGIMTDPNLNEDIRSLRWLLTYGVKGMAAYAEHAEVLGYYDEAIPGFIQEALALTLNDAATGDELVAKVLECGQVGVKTMALLDQANTTTYGHPEPTQVNIGVKPGPAILISGHDLRDLEELLKQTEGKGINIYTHGEMLPANAYPALKKYPHLVGNYGSSWWHQPEEFETFNGAILMTTNCLVPPKESYLNRLFTTGVVGWPGVPHIADRVNDQPKDFGPVIARALECPAPQELEQGTIPIGFAHNTVLSVADQVIAAIQSGAVKRFVVMAGCDGRHKTRSYFTDVAQALPEDSIILTAGCAKYRYNKLGLGEIGGIPRVLDAGQCNDSYSLVVVALKLAEVLGVKDVNELPIEYDIAWYEQKAVLVLLALLSLGVKKIRLGPTLPAFLSPNVAKVIVDTFGLRPTTTVEADVASIVARS